MEKWSKNEIDLAIDLCENGFKYEEIANELNNKKEAVERLLNACVALELLKKSI